MFIHIVKPGDTVYNIAARYNISPSRLIIENDISNPDHLVVNDALIILQPKQMHLVGPGETLDMIAALYDIDIMQILRNNPNVSERGLIPGEDIVISYYEDSNRPMLSINGFAFTYIDRAVLRKSLPYLTYITIMYYRVLIDGTLIDLDDEEIIQISKSYGVAPILSVSVIDENSQFDPKSLHTILNSEQIQLTLIENLFSIVRQKGYYGINVDIPYVLPADRDAYFRFAEKLLRRFNNANYKVFVTITPTTFEMTTRIEYEDINYKGLSEVTNKIIYLMTYDFYNPTESLKATLPFDMLMESAERVLSQVPIEIFDLGYSNVGFIWTLPITSLTELRFINITNAVELAYEVGAEISYNETTRAAYFIYIFNGQENIVWYRDVRFNESIIEEIKYLNIQGITFWNLMCFLPRIFMMYNVNFDIKKIDLLDW